MLSLTAMLSKLNSQVKLGTISFSMKLGTISFSKLTSGNQCPVLNVNNDSSLHPNTFTIID